MAENKEKDGIELEKTAGGRGVDVREPGLIEVKYVCPRCGKEWKGWANPGTYDFKERICLGCSLKF